MKLDLERCRGARQALFVAAALLSLHVASPARADWIEANTSSRAVSVGGGGVFNFTVSSSSPSNLASSLGLGAFPGLSLSGADFHTFCMDLFHTLEHPDKYEVVHATPGTEASWAGLSNLGGSVTTAGNVLKLFGTFFDDLGTPGAFTGFGSASVSDQYAAFQRAIWALEGTPTSNALANYFLTHLGSTKATNVVILNAQYLDGQGQNQITVINPVPAPPAWILASIGLLGLAGYRRVTLRGASQGAS